MSTIKILATLLSLNIASSVYAISFEVIGPCTSTPIYQDKNTKTDITQSLGSISLNVFNKQKIPYIGTEAGFNSILNTPTGDALIEVISDTKMRAYGWCYSVNSAIPDVLAGDYFLTNSNDSVVWFFAYSTYDSGNWTDYCVPSYRVSAKQFCPR